MQDIKNFIRDIPDFPKEGILFRDITPLLQDAAAFENSVNQLAGLLEGQDIDYLVGIESRGFIFASALSMKMQKGFITVRKPGKLPFTRIQESYDLEYGSDSLEIHDDSLKDGKNVVIVDDLLATGGTALATGNLIKQLNGNIVGYLFLIELTELEGAGKLGTENVWSLLKYND